MHLFEKKQCANKHMIMQELHSLIHGQANDVHTHQSVPDVQRILKIILPCTETY